MGSEQGAFNFAQVVSELTAKLLRRHPHVFPDGSLNSRAGDQQTQTAQVKETWEAIKSQEREAKAQHSVLDDVPLALPALPRAAKLQKRAARVGFDWPTIEPVIEKLHEELNELSVAQQQGDIEQVEAELGDVLFSCVNLARHLKVNPETALRRTNHKFEQRFRYIEQQVEARGLTLSQLNIDELDQLWDEAKQFLALADE